MSADPAQIYRRLAGQGVGLVGLVVQSYDQIINSLHRAGRAIQANEIEKKNADLNHALELIARLQNALDFERGGDVARSLEQFYNVARGQILAASADATTQALSQVADLFVSLREAWERVEKSTVTPSTPQAISPPQPESLSAPVSSPMPKPKPGWTA